MGWRSSNGPPSQERPLQGWRPRKVYRLHTPPKTREIIAKKIKTLNQGKPDIVTIRRVAEAGVFRVHRLVDLVPDGWFESTYYKQYYLADGLRDTMWAAIPINNDVEIYVGLFRTLDHCPFSEADVQSFAFALKGLKWFHRLQLLGEGIGMASEPLTHTEHLILHALLQGQKEREIAVEFGQSTHTTHDHIKKIYKKYGVSSRSALMALWLTP